MKYADLPKQRISHLVKPDGVSLEDWQVMLRMQQAGREDFEVNCVSERYNPGEYTVASPASGNTYKVVFRGPKSPWNYCDCMDFKTSQLGTCKHVEAARQWIADHHKRIHRDLPAYTSVYLSYRGNDRRIRIRVGSAASEAFRKLVRRYFNDLDELPADGYESFDNFVREARALDPTFKYYADAEDFVLTRREDLRRRKVVASKYDDAALDALLQTRLYDYQKEGVRFAAKAGRAIIADEMGLGKTVQAIATAELLRRECFVEQVLVLCPTTLKYQWKRELERFAGVEVLVIDGTPEQRRELLASNAAYKIASYNSINQDLKELKSLSTDMVIMDEVQRLKNWNTQIARAVRRIRSNYALILSGTPLENRLEELYSIVELVDQFLLSPYYLFRDRYIVTDATGRTLGYKNLQEVSKRIRPVLIRRTKQEVALQLPARIDKNLFVPMTREQLDAHHELKLQAARLVAKWHRMHFLSEMDRKQLLLTLSQMRMTCDSLFVLDERSRADTKVEEVMNILEECGVVGNGELGVGNGQWGMDNGQWTMGNGQWTMDNGAGTKVVIFSQWERMTRLVAQELEQVGVEFVYLHGSVPPRERKERVESFCSNPRLRVFLSTDAGSVGLNLQVANVVINLDVPWNPAVLEQRIGRVHRIGQQRGVEVINLISAGTIEEDMLSKLRFKASLFEGVLDGGADAIFLGSDQFDGLLNGLSSYIEEPEPTATEAIAQSDEEQLLRRMPVQTELTFEEAPVPQAASAPAESAKSAESTDSHEEAKPADTTASPDTSEQPAPAPNPETPLLQRLVADLAELLVADEETRRKAAEVLKNVKYKM